MKDLSLPLSDEEYARLDDFLLDRIDEEEDTTDKDEGVLGISELDGLFTAIVSGPVAVMPSKWLPAVYGDFEPVWRDEEEFQEILSLMMRHMNGIAGMLMDAPEDFEPIFLEREVEGRLYTIVDEWCEGYLRGVHLALDDWDKGGEAMSVLLTPILAFTERATGSGTLTRPTRQRRSNRPLRPMSGRFMPTGWRAGPIRRSPASRYGTPNGGWGATIHARAAAARSTRNAVCNEGEMNQWCQIRLARHN